MGWEYSEITVAVVKVSHRGEIKITKIRSVLLLAHAVRVLAMTLVRLSKVGVLSKWMDGSS